MTRSGIENLRRVIKDELVREVLSARRLIGDETEFTIQAEVREALFRLLGDNWSIGLEDNIPGTRMRADVVAYRVNADGNLSSSTGAIAIEVKPHRRIAELQADIDKLRRYVSSYENLVNFGMLVYRSDRPCQELLSIKSMPWWNSRKLCIRWLPKWEEDLQRYGQPH